MTKIRLISEMYWGIMHIVNKRILSGFSEFAAQMTISSIENHVERRVI